MATTKARSRPSTQNGTSAPVGKAVKEATGTAIEATRRTRGPLIAAGAATAGLVGGLAVGSRRHGRRHRLLAPRHRVLGVPIGPKSGLVRTAELLRDGARQLNSATDRVVGSGEELRQVREQLEQVNRRSPLEVVLDGLTHRRGAHRREG